MASENIKETFAAVIEQHPILGTYRHGGTRERLRRFPVEGVYEALRLRLTVALVWLGIFPKFRNMKTVWGDRVLFNTLSGWQLKKYGVLSGDELFLMQFMVAHIQPGDTVLDGGANVGLFTLLAAALADRQGLVCAFEPTPHTFARLQDNTRGKSNIVLEQLALAKSAGTAVLHDFGDDENLINTLMDVSKVPSAQTNKPVSRDIVITVTTIDAYCRAHGLTPRFIKLDLEGWECDALRGASETLDRHRPFVTAEAWNGRGLLRPLVDYMSAHSYDALDLTEQGAVPLDFDMDEFDAVRLGKPFDQKNLAFIPREGVVRDSNPAEK